MNMKGAIKRRAVVWVHGRVRSKHLSNPTWIAQTCRITHRAGVPWTVVAYGGPWNIRAYDGLRNSKYVCEIEWRRGRSIPYLTPDIVDTTSLTREGILQQMIARCNTRSAYLGTIWLDERGNTTSGLPTKNQLKDEANNQAVGGLRSPYQSFKRSPGAKASGAVLKGVIDALIE